ncbi:MAG: hypothetical protein ABEJ26_04970 [Halosimplex sp.]
MQPPTFRGKPSDSHVLWRRSGASADAPKRFDERYLRTWCSAHDVDFETDRRVDHDRADEPRDQYRLVFTRSEAESESFDMGDDEWEIAARETPRTFLEIDERGEARLESWTGEYVLDLEELRIDGTAFVFRAAEFEGTKRFDAAKLADRPE